MTAFSVTSRIESLCDEVSGASGASTASHCAKMAALDGAGDDIV